MVVVTQKPSLFASDVMEAGWIKSGLKSCKAVASEGLGSISPLPIAPSLFNLGLHVLVKSLLVNSQAPIFHLSVPFSILLFLWSKKKSFYHWINSNEVNYDQELTPSVELKHWKVFNFEIPMTCENNLEMSPSRQWLEKIGW